MTAYSRHDLKNLAVQQQAEVAKDKHYIDEATFRNIKEAYPVQLYQPNIAVRLGMGFLTVFVVLAVFGLLLLVTNASHGFGYLLVFIGIACYVAAEMMVSQKHHYNSGVDNILLLAAPLLIIQGVMHYMQVADVLPAFMAFIMCAWISYRFVDRLHAILASGSLLMFVFYSYISMGEFTITSYPFVIIASALLLYRLALYGLKRSDWFLHRPSFVMMKLVAIVSLYLGGNFYFIDQLTSDTYISTTASPLWMWWFFWPYTFCVPLAYLYFGIKKKDMMLLRAGVLAVAAAIITFRYYHAILPTEVAVIVAGSLVFALSYWLMRYLRKPKHGFVFEEEGSAEKPAISNVEAFVVGETFQHQAPVHEQERFGGGSFGGAGSGSNY